MSDLQPDQTQRKRRRLLILEFGSLAVLLLSMGWFSQQSATTTAPVSSAWLLVPAAASLGVFLSFIGLMYLRWVATATEARRTRHQIIFGLLAITLLSVWLYGIANTWLSLSSAN